MSRTSGNRKQYHPKPVQKVELSEKNPRLRLAGVILLLALGMILIGYSLTKGMSKEEGWVIITPDSSSSGDCGDEFVFNYQLGKSGTSPTAENKAITMQYTQLTENAFEQFHCEESFDGVNNLCYINEHPNEKIVVDAVLYDAFSKIEKYNNRSIYLGPVYESYKNLYAADNDVSASVFDPYKNKETKQWLQQLASFANDKQAISIELLGNSTIRLQVSAEYLAFAKENDITRFVDFNWMTNAFIADYIADSMIDAGYTNGNISSYDGFVRNLDSGKETYSFHIFHNIDDNAYVAGTMNYEGQMSIVFWRNYKLSQSDDYHYYRYNDNTTATSYIDVNDGMYKSALDELIVYSKEQKCADLMLQSMPIYVSDKFDADALENLTAQMNYIYCNQYEICHSDPKLSVSDLYDKDGIKFSVD